ncbi:uncharacterized protein LOC124302295 [Neodiprion virginianus]|uniref:uncharacterized protein LOC124302295 n=1 Tax=Neodiprion virginianus TaxID=2961670 RepID=UPI001EE75741|nr:uncharacterized protein LOC124302295 [Neodiprion virginianus]
MKSTTVVPTKKLKRVSSPTNHQMNTSRTRGKKRGASTSPRSTELSQKTGQRLSGKPTRHQQGDAYVYGTIFNHHVWTSLTSYFRMPPRVYMAGTFGPRVQKTVNEYAKMYSNVVITSSKSGKLTTGLYKDFLRNALKPYVQNEKFLLLIDSWVEHTNPELYDEMFQDDKKLPTCTMKVIPPKCTPLVQPCDVYFYRQVKNLTKHLQNCAFLIERDREINSREDCIKIQSIVHHQLSSPIFSDMIRYAWFASNLTHDRTIFFNVNQVCFPTDTLKNKCSCKNASFIRCAGCYAVLCFPCFYDNYYSGSCNIPATSCH